MAEAEENQQNRNPLVELHFPETLDITLDLITVHGMNIWDNPNHPNDTWTHPDSKKNWITDFLPQDLPGARILGFQYNANVAFSTSSASIEDHASNLLNQLWLARRGATCRPIIFIAHSLGGLIVKEALAQARSGDGSYASIWAFTYGIAFFGTPHRGSSHSSWGSTLASIIKTVSQTPDNKLLESTTEYSEYNERLQANFSPLLEYYRILSFCETLPHDIYRLGLVVNNTSATLGLSQSRETTIYLNRNHSKICKFFSETDPVYQLVLKNLVNFADSAVRATEYTVTLPLRERLFSDPNKYIAAPENIPIGIVESIELAKTVLNHEGMDLEVKAIEAEVEQLKTERSNLITILRGLFSLLWPIILPLTLVGPLTIASILWPWQNQINTARDRLREVNTVQRAVLGLELLTVEVLDEKRHDVLCSVRQLEQAMRSAENLTPEQALEAKSLKYNLEWLSAQIIARLHKKAQEVEQANREREKAELYEREAQLALQGQASQAPEDDSGSCSSQCTVM
ncbi:hypothetical protein BDZ45DRAFT_636374 [Acephala macrosclerotiorum]|nr:hypothetical protein BDZ45DRAFT_636374 [Acephala macrosclerotiorum]